MRKHFVPFAIGVLFGLGLLVSGMTDPAKVLGFLDVAGSWDPSLAFVMIGAIGVHAVALRIIRARRTRPLYVPTFQDSTHTRIDRPLVVGAILFGVGWGLAGICPGPALVSLGTGSLPAVVFFLFMAVGAYVATRIVGARARSRDAVAPLDGETIA